MTAAPLVTYDEVRHVTDLAHRIAADLDRDVARCLGPDMRVALVPVSRKKKGDASGKLEWHLLALVYDDPTGVAPIRDGLPAFFAEDLAEALRRFDVAERFDGQAATPEEKFAVLDDILKEIRDPEFYGLGPTRGIGTGVEPVRR